MFAKIHKENVSFWFLRTVRPALDVPGLLYECANNIQKTPLNLHNTRYLIASIMGCHKKRESSLLLYLFLNSSTIIGLKFITYYHTQWTMQGSVLALSMTFLFVYETDLRQIHTEDVFGPSLGGVWMSRSKVKCQGQQGQKTAFFGPFGGLRAVYVW